MTPEDVSSGPFPVYVPRDQSNPPADIVPGSAIVGFAVEHNPSTIHVYFEGNLLRNESLRRFADRARFAAGRCRWFRLDLARWRYEHAGEPPPPTEYGYVGYPTSAQAYVQAVDLVQVALYDDFLGVVTPIGAEQQHVLDMWIAGLSTAELLATGIHFEARRRTAQGNGSDLRPAHDAQ